MSGTALKMVVNWIYDTFSMKNELGLSDEEGRKVKTRKTTFMRV